MVVLGTGENVVVPLFSSGGKMKGGCMHKTIPLIRNIPNIVFHHPMSILRIILERMMVQRGSVNTRVKASPKGMKDKQANCKNTLPPLSKPCRITKTLSFTEWGKSGVL